jgi:hypothetical protein
MENNVQWGVPTQRTRKVEKFDTPVITMNSLAKKGAGRKFQFNKAAVEALGLEGGETYITFGFQGNNVLVMASSDEQSPASLKITKSHSISNKKTFEYIAKINALDTNAENYLHLTAVDGQPYMTVTSIEASGEDVNEDIPQTPTPEAEVVETEEEGKAEEVEAVEEETAESEW